MLADVFFAEARHHLGTPPRPKDTDLWDESTSPHVVRRDRQEGARLLHMAQQASKQADAEAHRSTQDTGENHG